MTIFVRPERRHREDRDHRHPARLPPPLACCLTSPRVCLCRCPPAVPVLKHENDLAAAWLPKLLSGVYDPRDVPLSRKRGATVGMSMTEKQGGSDVRANTTVATPITGASFPSESPGRPLDMMMVQEGNLKHVDVLRGREAPDGGMRGPLWCPPQATWFRIGRLGPSAYGVLCCACFRLELRQAVRAGGA
jgi:hypothetical protein